MIAFGLPADRLETGRRLWPLNGHQDERHQVVSGVR
jgi:hypothetical protein